MNNAKVTPQRACHRLISTIHRLWPVKEATCGQLPIGSRDMLHWCLKQCPGTGSASDASSQAEVPTVVCRAGRARRAGATACENARLKRTASKTCPVEVPPPLLLWRLTQVLPLRASSLRDAPGARHQRAKRHLGLKHYRRAWCCPVGKRGGGLQRVARGRGGARVALVRRRGAVHGLPVAEAGRGFCGPLATALHNQMAIVNRNVGNKYNLTLPSGTSTQYANRPALA